MVDIGSGCRAEVIEQRLWEYERVKARGKLKSTFVVVKWNIFLHRAKKIELLLVNWIIIRLIKYPESNFSDRARLQRTQINTIVKPFLRIWPVYWRLIHLYPIQPEYIIVQNAAPRI